MPKWLDDLKFTRPTWIDKILKNKFLNPMAWLDEIKFTRPTWIDNVVKLFTKDGRVGKSIMGIFDNLKIFFGSAEVLQIVFAHHQVILNTHLLLVVALIFPRLRRF